MTPKKIEFRNVSKNYIINHINRLSFRDKIVSLFKVNRLKNDSKNVLWALKDVGFCVKEGEALGIIGSNGSGKTTILRLLAGVSFQTSGDISIKGKVAPLIQVGAGFHPELTGRENIYLNGIILGLSKREIDKKFSEIVNFAELEHFIDTPVKRYSSGMYVRLGFSVAIHVGADILLIDEILSVGDLNFQRKCLDRMSKIRQTNKTIIFVSHNLAAVRGLCDKAIWLNRGKIEKYGKVDEVINAYTSFVNSTCRNPNKNEFLGLGARWGTQEVEILNVNITDSNEKSKSTVESCDDIKINLRFKSNKEAIENVYVWCCVMNEYAEKICGGVTEIKTSLRVNKIYQYSCIMKNINLIPGAYSIIVGIYDKFLTVPYDRWGTACKIQVISTKNSRYYGPDFHGHLNLCLNWEEK